MQPTPFGKYLLTERIAAGGMAEVFRAVFRGAAGFEKQVALKRILPVLHGSPEFVALFIDEARVVSTLTHVNIAQVFDFGDVDGSCYLAMELVDGLDLGRLNDALRRSASTMEPALAAFIIAEAARGLAYAHERRGASGESLGIVHRDLSPQNILISYAGDVKIADFGMAKAAGKLFKTGTGSLLGKLRYMSPEQIAGELIDGRSDVFALGTLLWELLTGRTLFDGDHAGRITDQVRSMAIPAPSSLRPGIPRELDEACLRALVRARDQRYGRASDLGRELTQIVGATSPRLTRDDLGVLVQELAPPRQGARAGDDEVSGEETRPLAKAVDLRRDPLGDTLAIKPPAPATATPDRLPSGRRYIWPVVAVGVLAVAALFMTRKAVPPGRASDGGSAAPDSGGSTDAALLPRADAATRARWIGELEALPRAEAMWRGVIADDYLAILSAVDSTLCASTRNASEPTLADVAQEAVHLRRLDEEARALSRYLWNTGELPPRIASALQAFLRTHPAYSPGAAGWAFAGLAVLLEPTRPHLLDLLRQNGALGHWRQPGESAHPELCERGPAVALIAQRAPGDEADGLRRYLAATPQETAITVGAVRYRMIGAERDEAAGFLLVRLQVDNPTAVEVTVNPAELRLAGGGAPQLVSGAPRVPAGRLAELLLRFTDVSDKIALSAVLVVAPGHELQAYSEALR